MIRGLLALLVLWAAAAFAQIPGGGSVNGECIYNNFGPIGSCSGSSQPPFTPSCSQSSTYLAALTSPTLTENQAFDTAICGMVSDGTFSTLNFLHFLTNTSTGNAAVNVISPGTYNLTYHGTCTFVQDRGLTGDASTCYGDTGFNTSTSASLNSFAMGVCVLNSRTTSDAWVEIGVANTSVSSYSYIAPLSSGTFGYDIFGATFPTVANPNGNAQGSWAVNRASSSAINAYFNGTLFNSTADTSQNLPNFTIWILAYNASGGPSQISGGTLGYDWAGNSSAGQIGQIYSRLHTMQLALGNSAC